MKFVDRGNGIHNFKNINVSTQFNGKQYCLKQVYFCGK